MEKKVLEVICVRKKKGPISAQTTCTQRDPGQERFAVVATAVVPHPLLCHSSSNTTGYSLVESNSNRSSRKRIHKESWCMERKIKRQDGVLFLKRDVNALPHVTLTIKMRGFGFDRNPLDFRLSVMCLGLLTVCLQHAIQGKIRPGSLKGMVCSWHGREGNVQSNWYYSSYLCIHLIHGMQVRYVGLMFWLINLLLFLFLFEVSTVIIFMQL